jgi:hypothetical protein
MSNAARDEAVPKQLFHQNWWKELCIFYLTFQLQNSEVSPIGLKLSALLPLFIYRISDFML